MVAEFHLANGAVINGNDNGPEVAVLRTRLIVEELAETYAALHENNVIEAADGLTDLLYVIYGAAVSYGVKCPDGTEAPLGVVATAFSRDDVLRFGRMALPRLQRVAISLAVVPGDCGPALVDLAEFIWHFGARVCSFPMQALFDEVHRSNMTKTFAKNTKGGKYGAVKAKGPTYSPPDIKGVLEGSGVPR
jgi:predicted HAD superfamily Cof-like phosphohydrolase